MKSKNPLVKVGETVDGRDVVSGVFQIKGQTGLPLENLIEILDSKGLVVSWLHLLLEAIDSGVNVDKFFAELRSAVLEVFGKEYWGLISDALERFKDSPEVRVEMMAGTKAQQDSL